VSGIYRDAYCRILLVSGKCVDVYNIVEVGVMYCISIIEFCWCLLYVH